jgi:hypothetical protein
VVNCSSQLRSLGSRETTVLSWASDPSLFFCLFKVAEYVIKRYPKVI